MDIKLKNIYVNQRMSEETTAFTADLHIDNYKAGFVRNDGRGGMTDIDAYNDKGRQLIKEAENYCKTLPPRTYPPSEWSPEPLTVEMNLENFVDDLVADFLDRKELARFQAKMEKSMTNGIVYGIPDKEFSVLRYNKTLKQVYEDQAGLQMLKRDIHDGIVPRLNADQKILNTNIPEKVLAELNIPPDKIVQKKAPVQTKGQEKRAKERKGRGRKL